MSFLFANPSEHLAPFIKQYWALNTNIHSGKNYIQRIVPNGLMELTIYLGNKPTVLNSQKPILENSSLSGQQKNYSDLKINSPISLFSISFLPYGAMMFFNLPLNELYNNNIPLKYIVGHEVTKLEDELYEASSFQNQIKLVETFLTTRLKTNNKSHEINRIYHTINRINENKGLLTVNSLAENVCLSRKQFERIFLEQIGASPKQFLKIIRFQNAIHQKQKSSNIQFTELAHYCGYYDQAHMINDFKSLAGMTPKQYFADCEPFSDYFE